MTCPDTDANADVLSARAKKRQHSSSERVVFSQNIEDILFQFSSGSCGMPAHHTGKWARTKGVSRVLEIKGRSGMTLFAYKGKGG